ncbi:hypothetical protein FF100_27430 [Methylobacterium terricola]|uniref:Uncharacterized protein n=1 Tax=Methylobacterium terricola TaxID=2583531 RepID=A0A5C4L9A7_9HYPH|nr:hypothetical protein [Methylobacterium terricola]TNC09039.1 hypothetical protein FF100_27430 [Methylobacterium terricola]
MADEERERRRDLYRLLGFDAEDFITAGELVGRLSATIDRDRCAQWQLDCLERDLAHAMQADHVRYHREAFNILLARLARHHHAGTHWFGKYYGEMPSWDDLVLAAIFDLKNFHGFLRARDEIIAYERDPLTFDLQVQVSIGGCVLRYDEDFGVIGRRLCGWLRDTSVGTEDLVLERVRNVVWFLPIEL